MRHVKVSKEDSERSGFCFFVWEASFRLYFLSRRREQTAQALRGIGKILICLKFA
jgi:hypothetical protein